MKRVTKFFIWLGAICFVGGLGVGNYFQWTETQKLQQEIRLLRQSVRGTESTSRIDGITTGSKLNNIESGQMVTLKVLQDMNGTLLAMSEMIVDIEVNTVQRYRVGSIKWTLSDIETKLMSMEADIRNIKWKLW